VRIADFSTATDSLTVAGCTGTASATTKVAVHITHTYRGDLAIYLIAPDGRSYKMKATNGDDDADNLDATYTVNASGQARNGVWKLQVRDAYQGDTGTLTGWSITL
jgi:subtilisin-like proprotein convertase family protein